MKTLAQAFLILLLSTIAAVGTYLWHPRAPAFYLVEEDLREDEITMPQIYQRWDGDVLWIDARSDDRYAKEHIPGALLLNELNFDNQLLDLLPILQKNLKPVIFYCDSGRCEASRRVREKFMEIIQISKDDCFILQGGWPAWKAAQTTR